MQETIRWLPVVEYIAFKTITLKRASIAGTTPAYIREICVPFSRQLY